MTPDEKEIQEQKIILMNTALVLGVVWGVSVLVFLWVIVEVLIK